MKKSYDKNITLRCITCGDTEHFEFNDEKTWIKCTKCNREYPGGYDELIDLNQQLINEQIEETKSDLIKDVENEFKDMLKKTFSGNKNFKIE